MNRALQACSLFLPAVLGAGAIGLMCTALAGSSDLPPGACSLVGHPAPAPAGAAAPEELSSRAVSRDWEEVDTSPATPTAEKATAPETSAGEKSTSDTSSTKDSKTGKDKPLSISAKSQMTLRELKAVKEMKALKTLKSLKATK